MNCRRTFRSVLPVLFLAAVESVKLPSHWARCKKGALQNDCLKRSIQNAMRDLEKGNRTLGVQPLDPWKIKLFMYDHGSGPVALKLTARDTSILGFKNVKVDHVRTDWEKMELQINSSKLTIFGKYVMNGSLIFLPVEGKGNFRFTLDDFTTKMNFIFEKFNKKGKEFVKVKEATFLPEASKIRIRFDNLFNGNKVLGDRMNDVLNYNWRLILDTVQPITLHSLGEPAKIVANALFSRVPAKDFILE
ncbi:protein takeout-like [Cimex lectularius]|uniref:Protein takeout n=1 Tax=Cimex lectularius TaxID=79782 RepID=A0A8I6RM82_CIMLE|nr:protein takeout-like [Cimex lectularius]